MLKLIKFAVLGLFTASTALLSIPEAEASVLNTRNETQAISSESVPLIAQYRDYPVYRSRRYPRYRRVYRRYGVSPRYRRVYRGYGVYPRRVYRRYGVYPRSRRVYRGYGVYPRPRVYRVYRYGY